MQWFQANNWEQELLGAWRSQQSKGYVARAFGSVGQEEDFSFQNYVFESKV